MPMSERQLAEHLVQRIDGIRGGADDLSLDALFALLQIRRIDACPPNGQDGLYVEANRTVFINPAIRTPERRRFTAYHEVTHAIVADDTLLQEELAEMCPDDQSERLVVEMLCNVGAAEFIIPRARFVPFIRGFDSPLGCVATACDEFRGASLPAVAQQIAQYSETPGMVLICAEEPIRCQGGWRSACRHVQYAFLPPWPRSARYRPRPKRFQVLRPDHPLSAMFDRPQPFSGEAYYPYDTDRRIPCWCEGAWHSRSYRAVAQLTERRPQTSSAPQRLLDLG